MTACPHLFEIRAAAALLLADLNDDRRGVVTLIAPYVERLDSASALADLVTGFSSILLSLVATALADSGRDVDPDGRVALDLVADALASLAVEMARAEDDHA